MATRAYLITAKRTHGPALKTSLPIDMAYSAPLRFALYWDLGPALEAYNALPEHLRQRYELRAVGVTFEPGDAIDPSRYAAEAP